VATEVESNEQADPTTPVESRKSWWDERTGWSSFVNAVFRRQVPAGLSWWYSLGAATLFVFVLQLVTGILLSLNYAPTPDTAYDSVLFINSQVPFGWFIRGLHHWGASAMVVLVVAHMVSAFVLGAHRAPREVTWGIGVCLLLITMAFGFTGYLLPWDQKAYWATTVGTNMAGTFPLIGSTLLRLLRGGADVGAVTLTQFYSIHVLILPLFLLSLVLAHLALVIYHGVSVPPGIWARLKGSYAERYKHAKEHGPAFWPEVIADDLRLSAIIFVILIVLSVVAGPSLEARADPTDTAYIPRPEWYFLALFELLKFFPGSLEWLGVIVVPGAVIATLFLAPALSRGVERRPLKRPAGLATVAVLLLAGGGLTFAAAAETPPTVVVEHGRVLTSMQLRGKQLIAEQGCTGCHVINGQGGNKGPVLDGIKDRMTAADIHFFMEKPTALNPAAVMQPLIPPLTHEDVESITQYLLTLDSGTTAP